MLFIPSRLDGDLSELEGGGGHLIYLYYMSNIEAWPIFFLADLQVMVSDHVAFREVALTYLAC